MSDDGSFSNRVDTMRRASTGETAKVIPLHPGGGDEKDQPLPGEGSDYQAASRQSNKPLISFCCIQNGKAFRSGGRPYHFFQYVHMDSAADFGYDERGQVMTLRFAGMVPVSITVHGRNLLQICDYLQKHRLAWIREADRDFQPQDAVDHDGRPNPIITSLLITPAKGPKLVDG